VKRVAVGFVALALLVAAWTWWRSDRRQIGQRLERLERACEKQGPSNLIALAGRAETIIDSFAPGFVVSARPYAGTISDPRELVRAIEGYRSQSELVRIHDTDRRLDVRDHGTAEMSAIFVIQGRRRSGPSGGRFRASLFWVKGDDGWKVHDLEIVQVLDNRGLFP
jgi:hypothetical protein